MQTCPGLVDWEREEDCDDGFKENLGTFYQEIKQDKRDGVEIKVVGADNKDYLLEEAVLLAVPDQPDKVYRQKIFFEEGTSYHILEQTEEVPVDVEPIRVIEVKPGEYRKLSDVEIAEMDMYMARINLEDEPQHRSFEEVFEEMREPFP